MTLVVPNEAEVIALKAVTGNTAAAAWTLRLFSNNLTLGSTNVFASFTEVTGGGYAAKSLTAASWTFTPGTPSSAQYAAQTFTFTGATSAPGTIYGYYITDANSKIVLAERLTSPPFTPAANGDSVAVTPVLTLGSTTGD